MVEVFFIIIMMIYMMVNGKMDNNLVMVYINMVMVISMKVNGMKV